VEVLETSNYFGHGYGHTAAVLLCGKFLQKSLSHLRGMPHCFCNLVFGRNQGKCVFYNALSTKWAIVTTHKMRRLATELKQLWLFQWGVTLCHCWTEIGFACFKFHARGLISKVRVFLRNIAQGFVGTIFFPIFDEDLPCI